MNNFSFKRVSTALFWVYFVFTVLIILAALPPSKTTITKGKITGLAYEIKRFHSENGHYPESVNEVKEIEKSRLDAWGEPFRYERKGDSFTLCSAGRDKRFGTKDDILHRYPEEKSE